MFSKNHPCQVTHSGSELVKYNAERVIVKYLSNLRMSPSLVLAIYHAQ